MRRLLFAAGLILVLSLPASVGLYQVKAVSPTPDPEAIQTQIANLEATLTAVASPPTVTPTTLMEFDFIDTTFGDVPFHIIIKSFAAVDKTLYDYPDGNALKPRGQFFALRFEITNMGTEPTAVWSSFLLLLRDNKGRAFSSDSDASSALMFDLDIYDPILQPALPSDAVLVYDVAKDATSFSLEVEDTPISIPLTAQAPIR
jgi:hypothetical protein